MIGRQSGEVALEIAPTHVTRDISPLILSHLPLPDTRLTTDDHPSHTLSLYLCLSLFLSLFPAPLCALVLTGRALRRRGRTGEQGPTPPPTHAYGSNGMCFFALKT